MACGRERVEHGHPIGEQSLATCDDHVRIVGEVDSSIGQCKLAAVTRRYLYDADRRDVAGLGSCDLAPATVSGRSSPKIDVNSLLKMN